MGNEKFVVQWMFEGRLQPVASADLQWKQPIATFPVTAGPSGS